MSTRTIIVSDVHGCLDELEALLDDLRFVAGQDRLITVGDLVGKGPNGAGVVRFFREGGHEAVLGNHDEKLLKFKRGALRKPLAEAHQAHADAMSDADWEWLAALPLWLRLPEYEAIVVHAGLVPGVPLERQRQKDLLNIRTLRANGTGSSRPDDGVPWASLWQGPERVIFGHDAVRGLQKWPHAIGLDTGCCYGGRLSALVLPSDRVARQRAFSVYVAVPLRPIKVCQVSELDDVRAVAAGRFKDGRPREVIVLKDEGGQPRAYVNRCEHLPVPLDGGSRRFLSPDGAHLACGTHGALFRFDDGFCTEGPCRGLSLEKVPLTVNKHGWVIIDC